MHSRIAGNNRVSRLGMMANVAIATVFATANICAAQSTIEGPRRFELRIENGRLADHVKTIQARRGEALELVWSADRRTTLHLHGYDVEITVDVGNPQTMAFLARATGRFPIEMHGGRHTVLLYLEVHPR